MSKLEYTQGRLIYSSPDQNVKIFEGVLTASQVPIAIKEQYFTSVKDANPVVKEAMSMYKLQHPAIIKLFDCTVDALENRMVKTTLIVELMQTDINKLMKLRAQQERRWSERQLLSMLKSLTSALAFAQQNDIAHRDVKPQNIFASEDESVVKIGDFGSSSINSSLYSDSSEIRGSPLYLSPILKQGYNLSLRSLGQVNHHNLYKSDLYSLGITFLQLARLKLPTEMLQVDKLQEFTQKLVGEMQVYPVLQRIVWWMLTINEDSRPDFLELEKWLEGVELPAEMPPPPMPSQPASPPKAMGQQPMSQQPIPRSAAPPQAMGQQPMPQLMSQQPIPRPAAPPQAIGQQPGVGGYPQWQAPAQPCQPVLAFTTVQPRLASQSASQRMESPRGAQQYPPAAQQYQQPYQPVLAFTTVQPRLASQFASQGVELHRGAQQYPPAAQPNQQPDQLSAPHYMTTPPQQVASQFNSQEMEPPRGAQQYPPAAQQYQQPGQFSTPHYMTTQPQQVASQFSNQRTPLVPPRAPQQSPPTPAKTDEVLSQYRPHSNLPLANGGGTQPSAPGYNRSYIPQEGIQYPSSPQVNPRGSTEPFNPYSFNSLQTAQGASGMQMSGRNLGTAMQNSAYPQATRSALSPNAQYFVPSSAPQGLPQGVPAATEPAPPPANSAEDRKENCIQCSQQFTDKTYSVVLSCGHGFHSADCFYLYLEQISQCFTRDYKICCKYCGREADKSYTITKAFGMMQYFEERKRLTQQVSCCGCGTKVGTYSLFCGHCICAQCIDSSGCGPQPYCLTCKSYIGYAGWGT